MKTDRTRRGDFDYDPEAERFPCCGSRKCVCPVRTPAEEAERAARRSCLVCGLYLRPEWAEVMRMDVCSERCFYGFRRLDLYVLPEH